MKSLKEIFNYFKYLKIILYAKKHNALWKEFKFKLDWFGRVWFVLNLRDEDLGEPDLVKKSKVIQRLQPYHAFFEEELELSEAITVSVEQKTDRSFLIVYYPIFKYLTVFKVFMFVFISFIFSFLLFHFNIISEVLKLF
jgi:hypothetical protein